MIENIDIPSFGSFNNFVWSSSVRDGDGNTVNFKKLNVLYGRNYSGKTTLSRILRSLKTGKMPENYELPSFFVKTALGIINKSNIPTLDHHVRVYNKDFVDDHLGFLRDKNGKITSFAIIGSENKIIEKEISEKEIELGNVEGKKGIRYHYSIKNAAFLAKQSEKTTAENDLSRKLTNKATQQPNGIKHNPLFKDPNYNTPKIQADIKTIRSSSFEVLDEYGRKEREALLAAVPLPDIDKKLKFNSNIKDLYEKAGVLLAKKITPTKPIQNLLDDALLQGWVKEGIQHHRDKRAICGFCGQSLPNDFWGKLDEHFSKESSDLEVSLNQLIKDIEKERETIDGIVVVKITDFYSSFHQKFDIANKAIDEEVGIYKSMLSLIIKSLSDRVADIFTPKPIPELNDNASEIQTKIATMNDLIVQNNKKTASLADDQNKARKEIRLSEIAKFIKDIDLVGEENKISTLQKKTEDLKLEADKLQVDIKALEKQIQELQIKLKDEKKGAEKVNEYLNHYFGHEGIRLEAVEDKDTSAFKFQILRGGKPAYNLSEGECSLVSFCYFMAKLEDTDSKGKDLIIYIDDPISSLDSNHIFFIYSLIENLIAKPEEDSSGNKIKDANDKPVYRYKQLFISTHNLEFLKYLKKLSKPKKDHEQFMIVGKKNSSVIEVMPKYLKNYITEFNYLFEEIYKCSDPANSTNEHHCFYNFGNNLRKFLEVFLFFKYPFSENQEADHNQRISSFFKDSVGSEPLVQRLINEFSHLAGAFDRSVQPIDSAEISKLANFVLRKIKDNDKSQYECLLQSIGQPDPLLP